MKNLAVWSIYAFAIAALAAPAPVDPLANDIPPAVTSLNADTSLNPAHTALADLERRSSCFKKCRKKCKTKVILWYPMPFWPLGLKKCKPKCEKKCGVCKKCPNGKPGKDGKKNPKDKDDNKAAVEDGKGDSEVGDGKEAAVTVDKDGNIDPDFLDDKETGMHIDKWIPFETTEESKHDNSVPTEKSDSSNQDSKFEPPTKAEPEMLNDQEMDMSLTE